MRLSRAHLPCSFPVMGTQWKDCLWPGSRVSPDTKSTSTWSLDFPVSRLWKVYFCSLQASRSMGICYSSLERLRQPPRGESLTKAVMMKAPLLHTQPDWVEAALICFPVIISNVPSVLWNSSNPDRESHGILNVPCRMTLFWTFVIVVVFQRKTTVEDICILNNLSF